MTKGNTIRVLHLDDDPFELDRIQKALKERIAGHSFHVESTSNVEAFDQILKKNQTGQIASQAFDVVILDVHIEETGKTGVKLAKRLRQQFPKIVILMCSNSDDVPTITACLQAGADDFLSKESDKQEVCLRIFNAYRLAKVKQGSQDPIPQQDMQQASFTKMPVVGNTMYGIARRVPYIINSAITSVFIHGESGSGKEVVADLMAAGIKDANQQAGDQKQKTPFLKVNCGAIAPNLLESELFGHQKGAFTGATSDKQGYFEAAHGGWIFLDEVATLSPMAQQALLRVLENQEILRVGSTTPIKVDVRVLSATHESLQDLVQAGRFRADLWQRLRETEIHLPPLRERPAELPELIRHFCDTMPGGPYKISKPALDILASFSWQEGNVRELRNCLRAMTELHVNKVLTPLAIPARILDELGETSSEMLPEHENDQSDGTLDDALQLIIQWPAESQPSFDDLAEQLLLKLTQHLAKKHGKLSLRSLSQHIGVSRSTLSNRLKSLVQKGLVETKELSRYVGIND